MSLNKAGRVKRAVVAGAVAGGAIIGMASPADAWSLSCSKWISGRTAYASCRGSATFRVTAQCHWWGANSSGYVTVKGGGSATVSATCPAWSKVTYVYIEAR